MNEKPSMARSGKVCIELNFIRGGEGRSRRSKIKSFWEFIDAQKDLVPLRPSQGGSESIMNCSNSSVCKKSEANSPCGEYNRNEDSSSDISGREIAEKESTSDYSDVCNRPDQLSSKKRIWYDELRIFKELGLDRVALVASNACKSCLKDERNNVDKEPEFADSVPQPYEELAADLKAFQERLKDQKPKCVYKEPGKYEHLMQ